MARHARFALAVSASVVLAPLAECQTLPLVDGYAARALVHQTSGAWRVRGLAPGLAPDEVWFAIGSGLYRADGVHPPQQVTLSPGGGDVGLVVRPRAQGALFYSDFVNATLVQRDLSTGQEALRSLPANTFDLEITLTGDILVAANPAWPAPGSGAGVFVLPPGQAAREIVRLAGPSAPILIDAATGDLLCAELTAGAPAPPGSVRILRFTRAQVDDAIAHASFLRAGDATVFATGLDGAFDLAQDDRRRICVSDPVHGDVRRIAPSGVLDPAPLVARNGSAALELAFVDGGAPSFDAWQPDDGATLLCATSDFSTAASLFAVRPAPPVLRSAQAPRAAPGAVHVDIDGLPPLGAGTLFVDLLPTVPRRAVAQIAGVSLFSDLDFGITPIAVSLAVDASGHASFDLIHPGGFTLLLTLAALGSSARAGDPLALSASLTITLVP